MAGSDSGATLTALAALLTAATGFTSALIAGIVTLRRRKAESKPASALSEAAISAAVAAEVKRILAENGNGS